MSITTIDADNVTSDGGLTREEPVYKIKYFITGLYGPYDIVPKKSIRTIFISAGKSDYDCSRGNENNPDGYTVTFFTLEELLETFLSEIGSNGNGVQIVSMKLISVIHRDGDCSGA